jgi:5'-deoxynucleotidase YfbR-like HD superfamily hydrolase
MHDVAETYTGDVPAPFKWDNNAAALGIAEGELAYINGCNIPCPELTKEEAVILKVADMLDLVLSSIEDLKRGNTYSQALLMNGLSYLDNMEMPDDIRVMADEMIQEVRHAAG